MGFKVSNPSEINATTSSLQVRWSTSTGGNPITIVGDGSTQILFSKTFASGLWNVGDGFRIQLWLKKSANSVGTDAVNVSFNIGGETGPALYTGNLASGGVTHNVLFWGNNDSSNSENAYIRILDGIVSQAAGPGADTFDLALTTEVPLGTTCDFQYAIIYERIPGNIGTP